MRAPKGVAGAGVPALLIPLLVAFDVNTRAGRVDVVSDTVAPLAGGAPATLRAFLAANKAAFNAPPPQ